MKIKQMADEIRTQMPKDLDELETLRYIYIYLGKRKNFDPQYYFGNSNTKRKIYTLAKEKMNDEEFLTSKRNLICTSISSTLKLLGKEFGINIELVKDEFGYGAHMFNRAILKDGRKVHLDLQQDLVYIHSGEKTQSFGANWYGCNKIEEAEIEQIDQKIGYKKKHKGYKKEQIMLLGKKLANETESDKVKHLFNSEEFNEVLKNSEGYVELKAFIEETLLNIRAYGTEVITCYRDKNINKEPLTERQYSMCVLTKEDNIYMFKQKEKRFVELSIEQMKRLTRQGMKLKSTIGTAHAVLKLEQMLKEEPKTLEK